MPRSRIAALLAVLATAVAVVGCGGDSDVSSDEVPVTPPALDVPAGSNNTATKSGSTDKTDSKDSGDTEGSTSSTSTTDESTSSSGASSSQAAPQATAAPSQQNGGAAAQGQQDNGNAGQNTGGASPDFDEFCQQNPGAC